MAQTSKTRRSNSRIRPGYFVATVLVALLAIGAVVVAAIASPSTIGSKVDAANLPVGPEAPPLIGAKAWLNGPPVTATQTRGKVVLYDFWTYSCVNCVRTLPHVRAWYDRYKADGLEVVGIHSPEFQFEKSTGNVQEAATKLGVTWPVAVDSNLSIWDAFKNQYWPAKYITDRQGHIRYTHFGEGNYDEAEDVIRSLLGVKKSAPRAGAAPSTDATVGVQINPETYLGSSHGAQPIQAGTHSAGDPGTLAAPDVALVGTWTTDPEYSTNENAGASIVVGVQAREANLVMTTKGGGPIDVDVELDGKPVPAPDRGASLHLTPDGRTVMTVQASDLYRIIRLPGVEQHQLRLTATQPGLRAYAFTFG
ncbi:MAG: transrane protein [Actinomycetia bacterium]|nr:transrane protein [Actinomycetes bacterium]